MQNGLYVATSGLLMQQRRLDVISNNVANVNTNGFKRELTVFSDYRPVDKRYPQNGIQKTLYNKTINSSVKLDDINTDFEMGHFKQTENSFDVALQDIKNFFAVDTPWGIRYTRDGEFTMNSNGELVTRDGFNLPDRNTGAPIVIPPDHRRMDITNDGVVYIDNAPIGQIDVVRFEEPEYLQKVGRNLYTAVSVLPDVPLNATVTQGYVETSNVDPIMEMVRMIDAMRGFELYQKVVHTYDSMNEQAANAIAKV